MCRMALVTSTRQTPRPVLDLLLRMGQEDNGQNDGAGVYIGGEVYTTASPLQDWSAPWMRDATSYVPMLGHRRKASTGTGRTLLESHPYKYTVGDDMLVFAHNGYISGTGSSKVNEPNTDSWRAGRHLADMLAEGRTFDAALITEWLSGYTDAAFAMMFFWKDQIFLTRNSKRTFFLRQVGDGYIGASSHAALTATTESLYDAADLKGDVLILLPDQLVAMQCGSHELTVLGDVKPTYKTYTQSPAAVPATYPNQSPYNATPQHKKKDDENGGGDGDIYLPAYMPKLVNDPEPPPTEQALVLAPRTQQHQVASPHKGAKKLLAAFYARFSPLSKNMVNLWLATLLDLFDATGSVSKSLLYPVLLRLLSQPNGLDDLVEYMYSSQKINARVVNFWNHMVNAQNQPKAAEILFQRGQIWWLSHISVTDDQLDQELRRFRDDVVDSLQLLDRDELRLFNVAYVQQVTDKVVIIPAASTDSV